MRSQEDWKSDFLSLFVPLYDTIKTGGFSCLSMHIVRSHRINLNVETICSDELLIYVISICPDLVPRTVVYAAAIVFFSEELFASSSVNFRIVDEYIVSFGIKWLLDKWFLQLMTVQEHTVIFLLNCVVFIFQLFEVASQELNRVSWYLID